MSHETSRMIRESSYAKLQNICYASHGRTEHCDCTKHGPVRQDQPRCDNLIVLRDPRSRQASHFRYRRLVVSCVDAAKNVALMAWGA